MARQLNDVLEQEREIEGYRDALYLLKSEIHRLQNEYLEGAKSLGRLALDEINEELATLIVTIENALF
jgi:hypothetical protein